MEEVRDIVRDLARMKRDRIVPRDEEKEMHEREEHREGAFELEMTAARDMEGIMNRMDELGAGGQNDSKTKDVGEDLLDAVDRRLRFLEERISSCQ